MVEPYLLHANGNTTSSEISKGLQSNAQTTQPWQNGYLFPATERNHNSHQLFHRGDDNFQFNNEVRPGPSRLAHTSGLSRTNIDVLNDLYSNENGLDTHAKDSSAAHSLLNHHTPHTITTGQLKLDNNVVLPDLISQSLPHITVANFAKENVNINDNNGANVSSDTLDIFAAADWMKEVNAVNDVFDMTEQLPNAIVATAQATTTIADDLKWEDIFGVMNQQLIPAANDPQPGTSTGATISNTSAQNAPKTHQNWIELLQNNEANATRIDQQNQPRRVTYQANHQMNNVEQAFDNGQIFAPHPPHAVTNMFAAQSRIATFNDNHIERTPNGTIPIKFVRSTKQYETLIEMGYLKKDIETALRKCNLDLYETIEYLSEPKRKRRKKDQRNDLLPPYQYHAEAELLSAIQRSHQESNIQQAHEQPNKVVAEPIIKKPPANLYEELLQLEESSGIVKSIESFDCEICMETIEMKDGMILRNCLHRYCKDCLNGTIVHSDDVTIKCPYVSCEEIVQDREVRAVLSHDEYEKFLMKGVRVAQVTISGTILCNLPDCDGWCICEDVVNEFKCPQCKNINCIPCKAIHPERNCREYQDDLAAGDANGIISGQRRSEQAIQDLINRNEAMKCFKCGILIMKRDGCDYIECVMCKAGICWATRGPRYGPNGVGDLSGGCHCTVQKRCHKDCRGCH